MARSLDFSAPPCTGGIGGGKRSGFAASFSRFAPLLLMAIVYQPTLQAQSAATETSPAAANAQSQDAQLVRRLQAIRSSLEGKREQVRNLLENLQNADESGRADIRQRIEQLQQEIRDLAGVFERTAVNGLNLQALDDPEKQILDWRDELVQIARPILDSLKEATQRPRRIAELRTSIDLYGQQLEQTRKAIESLTRFDDIKPPPNVVAGLTELKTAWQRRQVDIENSLSIARNELQFLESEDGRVFETMGSVTYDFILGRGLTLLLAVVSGIALWFLMRLLRRSISHVRRTARMGGQPARVRLLLYGYHLLTIILVTLAVLSVFYLRGDLLLLSLAMVALVMLALGVWRFLPGYIREARLLLNAGSARQGERVTYNGLPFRIESLNLYSELRNPELEGRLRLPLAALAGLTSRPEGDESWFPCRPGDYLLLPGGDFAEVLRQTIELVQVRILGSLVQYASADFLRLNARNLTREGFGLVVVFGIDYQHQRDALGRIPERIDAGLQKAFAESDYAEQLQSLTVEFKSAGASSLDYLIYVSLDGQAAAAYFKIGRLIQQTCVDICNRENWVIPFAQLMIHQAEDTAPGPDGSEPVDWT